MKSQPGVNDMDPNPVCSLEKLKTNHYWKLEYYVKQRGICTFFYGCTCNTFSAIT